MGGLLGGLLATTCDGGDGGWEGAAGLSDDVAREVAIRLSTCLGDSPGTYLIGLTTGFGLPPDIVDVDAASACMRQAADCPGVLGCIGIDTSERCADRDVCGDDNTLRTCWRFENGSGYLRTVVCTLAAGGDRCVAGPNGAACGVGTCGAESAACEGEVLVTCDAAGHQSRVDCGARGFVCRTFSISFGDDGGPTAGTCVAADDGCSERACDGDVATACAPLAFARLRVATVDCGEAAPGSSCAETDDGTVCKTSSGDVGCFPEGNPCDGATIVHCFGGVPVRFDCGRFLGATCQDTEGYGRCKAPGWDGP